MNDLAVNKLAANKAQPRAHDHDVLSGSTRTVFAKVVDVAATSQAAEDASAPIPFSQELPQQEPKRAPLSAVADAPPPGLQILPPIVALIELAVMVAGLLLLEWSYPNLDIVNLQPSPYWIPVLLLTLQYGTPSGSLAAILAIAIYFTFGNFPEQGVGENEFTYRLRILVQPILWIAAAVLLGQFRMVQIATKRELTQRLATLETQAHVLADYATRLRSRCDVLERTIAGQGITHGAPLLEALAALTNPSAGASSGSSKPALERCLAAAFPLASVSVFIRHGDQLMVLAKVGWPQDAPWPTTISKTHPLYSACVESRRQLSILDATHERYLDGHGFAVVPILNAARSGNGAGSDVVGILKIEQIEARSLTPNLPAAMAALAASIAPSLAHERADERKDHAGPVAANLALSPQNDDARADGDTTAGAIAIDLIRPKVLR